MNLPVPHHFPLPHDPELRGLLLALGGALFWVLMGAGLFWLLTTCAAGAP